MHVQVQEILFIHFHLINQVKSGIRDGSPADWNQGHEVRSSMGPPGQDVCDYRSLPPYHQSHVVNGSLPQQVKNWTF
jgi:hypothetical protein